MATKTLTKMISEGEYQLPFKPNSRIKRHRAPFHKKLGLIYCIDWATPIGTPILAARDGRVAKTESRFNSYGGIEHIAKANYIVLYHEDREYSVYAHLKWRGLKVQKGDKVKAGQIIGYSGQTGFATYPHLHFGIYKEARKSGSLDIKSRIINGELISVKVKL